MIDKMIEEMKESLKSNFETEVALILYIMTDGKVSIGDFNITKIEQRLCENVFDAAVKKYKGYEKYIEQDGYERGYSDGYSKGDSDGRFFGSYKIVEKMKQYQDDMLIGHGDPTPDHCDVMFYEDCTFRDCFLCVSNKLIEIAQLVCKGE